MFRFLLPPLTRDVMAYGTFYVAFFFFLAFLKSRLIVCILTLFAWEVE